MGYLIDSFEKRQWEERYSIFIAETGYRKINSSPVNSIPLFWMQAPNDVCPHCLCDRLCKAGIFYRRLTKGKFDVWRTSHETAVYAIHQRRRREVIWDSVVVLS